MEEVGGPAVAARGRLAGPALLSPAARHQAEASNSDHRSLKMDEIEIGKHILAVAKSLKAYKLGDPRIAAFLYASSLAGRAGLFTSALRSRGRVERSALTVLAAEEGLAYPELRDTILPWLEDAGLVRIRRLQDGEIESVESLVLGYDGILRAVTELYGTLNPTAEDKGCIQILDMASQMPQPESDVMQVVASVIGDEKAKTAVELVKAYRLVSHRAGRGLREPVLYSQRLWGRCIDKAAAALSSMDNTEKAIVLDMVEQVRRHQGMPELLLRQFAADNNAVHLLELAVGVGLVNRTDIQMTDGTSRTFLTSPHFYGDLADEHGEDMFDRVKIFLDSIRNGQHFGDPWTGRILTPEILLGRLLERGEIGPCTAIGRDYVMSEKAGIVRVRRALPGSMQHYMEVVQRDTVAKVLEVVTAGTIAEDARPMEAGHVTEGNMFRSIEQRRAEVGEVPEKVAEAERAVILSLREG